MDIRIINEENKSKISVNAENTVGIDISTEESLIPVDNVTETIDEYLKYVDEKDNSRDYRFIFTINPICSNVLFNPVTEIVYREGDPDNAIFFGAYGAGVGYGNIGYTTQATKKCPLCGQTNNVQKGKHSVRCSRCGYISIVNTTTSITGGQSITIPTDIRSYMNYKGYTMNELRDKLSRIDMIRDTGFSSKYAGKVVYHCGYDIFNNQMLRNIDFSLTPKIGSSISSQSEKRGFNSITDYRRDHNGKTVKFFKPTIITRGGHRYIASGNTESEHEHMYDTTLQFSKSIDNNLTEKDGWWGIENKCNMSIANYNYSGESVTINKFMNNNKVGEFIDMYPDRSLFSFIPKVNPYLNRIENNWDYCITYPYKSFYDNEIVQDVFIDDNNEKTVINGIRCTSAVDLFEISPDNDSKYIPALDEGDRVMLRSDIRNKFESGTKLSITLIFEHNGVFETYSVHGGSSVLNVGQDGTGEDYLFSINYTDVADYINIIADNYGTDGIDLNKQIYFRIAKKINGRDCKYYFRIFKKVPNFALTNVYSDNYVTDDEIEDNIDNGYNTTVNKMAFERTIYNDNKVQIIYNDNVSTKCLRDNLGRELSTLYLTFIKRNKGYNLWYPQTSADTVNPRNSEIEYSHCFGKLTAGLDLPEYVEDYNVHKIHNISDATIDKINYSLEIRKSPKSLEESVEGIGGEISYSGDTFFVDGTDNTGRYEFFGDIVEFSETQMNEVVLEDVYFRFNTAQRECEAFSVSSQTINGIQITNVIGEFANIEYDEIVIDDHDIKVGTAANSFDIDRRVYNSIRESDIKGNLTKETDYPANLFPEGYCYKAHYPIDIRKLSNTVNDGSHIRLSYTVISKDGATIKIETLGENYYIEQSTILYLYKKTTNHEKLTANVLKIEGSNFNEITFRVNIPNGMSISDFDINKYVIYKKNPLMPDFAYELEDGTGRYYWRELEKEVNLTPDDKLFNSMFTNGAYYVHLNINFFLNRQDPLGSYGVSYGADNGNGANSTKLARMTIEGKFKEIIRDNAYVNEEDSGC